MLSAMTAPVTNVVLFESDPSAATSNFATSLIAVYETYSVFWSGERLTPLGPLAELSSRCKTPWVPRR